MSELKHILKELEFHKNFIGEGFLKPPENNFCRVNVFGEVSSLTNFVEKKLYLFYEISLPLGWKVDNENEYYLIYKAENIIEENINKLKSISQVSECYVNPYSEGDPISDSEFNFIHNLSLPYELELLCHESALGKFAPKMLFQINSVDSEGRHRIEGYSFLEIPNATGSYNFSVPCYKPKEDNYMKIFSYFLGGSRKIPDIKELTKTASKNESNIDTVLNRYGISTEYTGNVNLHMNVVIQNKLTAELARRNVRDKEGRETYQLVSLIKEAIGEYKDEEEPMDMRGTMKTTNHGYINRYAI